MRGNTEGLAVAVEDARRYRTCLGGRVLEAYPVISLEPRIGRTPMLQPCGRTTTPQDGFAERHPLVQDDPCSIGHRLTIGDRGQLHPDGVFAWRQSA